MRTLVLLAGLATLTLGFAADARLDDPALLQGALTLGGGWLICTGFSYYSRWHGFIGAGILALLAAARCAMAIFSSGGNHAAPYQAAVLGIALLVLAGVLRALLRERARRERRQLLGNGD